MARPAVIVASVLFGSFHFAFAAVASGPDAGAHSVDTAPLDSGITDGTTAAGHPSLSRTLIMQHLDIANVDVRHVHVAAEDGAPFQVQVVLDSKEYTLDMLPRSLRAADFKLIVADDAGIHDVVPEEPRTYRGVVLDAEGNEIPGGGVAGTMHAGELTAMIRLGEGRTWFVESLSMAGLEAGPGMHAIYRGSDSMANGLYKCGVEDPPVPLPDGGGDDPTEGPAPRGTTFKVADIAFDGDFQFYQQNGSSVVNSMLDIETFFNVVEFIYERDTDISYEVTAIIIRTTLGSDPYTSGNCVTMLGQFQTEWNSNFGGVRRDTAHLITGQNLGGCGGVAFVGAVCNLSFAYGLTQHFSFSAHVAVTAHEVGHNWNACHCDEGGCISNPCRIMCSGAGGCPFAPQDFGPGAISQIVAFKNTRSCLFPGGAGTLSDPVPFPFSETFPITTLDESKWVYNDLAFITSAGINEPSASFSINLDSSGSGVFDQNELRTNVILAGGQPLVEVSYYTQHRGVENGEQLIVEYWASSLSWVLLNTITSDGVDQNDYVFHIHNVTALNARHDELRLRFRTVGSNSTDDWYIDDIFAGCQGGCCDCDGACCLSFGCLSLSESTCILNNGEFQGEFVECAPDPCPQPTGACCN
ncbi:MAG: M12 family metallo-peptidase, partial [Planctomycetota bacterium]|nr:M12 family metallo-peptidase [Planctomycetota bacterium]